MKKHYLIAKICSVIAAVLSLLLFFWCSYLILLVRYGREMSYTEFMQNKIWHLVLLLSAAALSIIPLTKLGAKGVRGKIHICTFASLVISLAYAFMFVCDMEKVLVNDSRSFSSIYGAVWIRRDFHWNPKAAFTAIAIIIILLAAVAIVLYCIAYAKTKSAGAENETGSAAGAEEEGGAVLAEIPEIAFLEYGEKKLNFVASTARENTSVAGKIAGPVAGFNSLRAKRIGTIKGQLTIWETGHHDVRFKEKVFESATVVGLNYPTAKGSDGTTYSSYIDVVIPGFGINRIIVDVAKVPSPADVQSGKAGPLVPLPVVTGWKNGGEISDAPICPAGYSPVTKGTVSAVILNYKAKLAECGLNPNLIGNVEYLRAKPWIFNSIEETSPLAGDESIDKSVAYDMCAIMNTLKAQKKK